MIISTDAEKYLTKATHFSDKNSGNQEKKGILNLIKGIFKNLTLMSYLMVKDKNVCSRHFYLTLY